jgi:3-oxoacyl-[acyl-carrier-protein] synthase-3
MPKISASAPGMGARWVTDIIADNNPDDDSYFPHMNGQFKKCCSAFC